MTLTSTRGGTVAARGSPTTSTLRLENGVLAGGQSGYVEVDRPHELDHVEQALGPTHLHRGRIGLGLPLHFEARGGLAGAHHLHRYLAGDDVLPLERE